MIRVIVKDDDSNGVLLVWVNMETAPRVGEQIHWRDGESVRSVTVTQVAWSLQPGDANTHNVAGVTIYGKKDW